MELIIDIILSLKTALITAFIFATILTVLCFFFNQFMLLYDFIRRILNLREGKVYISGLFQYRWDDVPTGPFTQNGSQDSLSGLTRSSTHT